MCENTLNERTDMIKAEIRPETPLQLQSASASCLREPISRRHEAIVQGGP